MKSATAVFLLLVHCTQINMITSVSHFTQSSPPSLCAAGRTEDLQSILSVMEDAQSFVYIAVMNYLPTMEFSHPKRYKQRKYALLLGCLKRVLFGCAMRLLPQVLGRHWHPAEESGVRKADKSSPADQLLGQHPATHVYLPQVSGLSLQP